MLCWSAYRQLVWIPMSWVDSPGPSLQAYLDQNTSILPMHLTDQSHFWESNIPPGFDWAGWRHPRYEICRISFIRQDDCSSKGRSIPDPTLQHQNSLESDFMTLPKPYDISVVLLDQALQVRRSSTLETHPTTAVSPLHLLAYLAHHLAPCSRRFDAGLRR